MRALLILCLVIVGCRGSDPSDRRLRRGSGKFISATDKKPAPSGVQVMTDPSPYTAEDGRETVVRLSLLEQPKYNVTIMVSTSNAAEAVVRPSQLVFTPANWSEQSVTVKGMDDHVSDGDQKYTLVLSPAVSRDERYEHVDADDVQLINLDDDAARVLVTPNTGLTTSENGGQATFTVMLASQPTKDCTLTLSSSNIGEGVLSVSQLIFTPKSWSLPQTVTVRGMDDSVADGAQSYRIRLDRLRCADPKYDNLLPPDVLLTNTDDDQAGFSVQPTSGLVTSEDGGTATFTVALLTMPESQVTIRLSSDQPKEGQVLSNLLSFNRANWSRPQTVTVKGVDDLTSDGPQTFSIILAPADSNDPNYRNLDPLDVSVSNNDNDPRIGSTPESPPGAAPPGY